MSAGPTPYAAPFVARATRSSRSAPYCRTFRSPGNQTSALDPVQGMEVDSDRLKKTHTNYEFLLQVQQTSSMKIDDEG
jgi:hypothetical protein